MTDKDKFRNAARQFGWDVRDVAGKDLEVSRNNRSLHMVFDSRGRFVTASTKASTYTSALDYLVDHGTRT